MKTIAITVKYGIRKIKQTSKLTLQLLRIMDILLYLVPITIILGLIGLIGFLWTVKNKQYEDLEGAANRILFDEEDDKK